MSGPNRLAGGRPSARPLHLRPGIVALVALGGAVGTGCRDAVERLVPTAGGSFPWATFSVNVSGAFVLGALLTALVLRGPDSGYRRLARLGLGTGLLGGYTTYSTFVMETLDLGGRSHLLTAAGYAVGSVVAGVGAAYLGTLVSRVLTPTRAWGDTAR